MKLRINLSGKTLYTFMREAGYSPASEELAFQRFLAGRPYPKFHAYCALSADEKSATLNLHLDQKKPSYKGSRAHSGEYDGLRVQEEVARILKL